jgi:hypothetical protein
MIVRSWRAAALAVALQAAAIPLAAAGMAPGALNKEPDWPCQQRLVPELAMAQMWNGPPPPDGALWQSDAAIAPLALELAEKPPGETAAKIEAFATAQPADTRAPRLALLFKASLEVINGQRSKEIAGIKRYTRTQQALAKKIADESSKLGNLPPGPDSVPPPELAEVKQARDWDIRVFEDRQRSLKYLCDQPVALEQHAFALAQSLESKLP